MRKLIRDNIPREIMLSQGLLSKPADDYEYRRLVFEKLAEESGELVEAGLERERFSHSCDEEESAIPGMEARDAKLLDEIADVQEVMNLILELYNISPETLADAVADKRRERGGFEAQLIWEEEVP